MKTLKKWFIRYVGIYTPEPIDEKKLKDWLFKSYKDSGFKQYYTMRKRVIVNLLILEDDPVKRAKLQGRLEELGGLSASLKAEVERRKEEVA